MMTQVWIRFFQNNRWLIGGYVVGLLLAWLVSGWILVTCVALAAFVQLRFNYAQERVTWKQRLVQADATLHVDETTARIQQTMKTSAGTLTSMATMGHRRNPSRQVRGRSGVHYDFPTTMMVVVGGATEPVTTTATTPAPMTMAVTPPHD